MNSSKPIIFYWRKPKTKMFVFVPKFNRYEEIVRIRGIQIFRKWFIGVYSFGEIRSED